jgi:transcription antitermination protein NusB
MTTGEQKNENVKNRHRSRELALQTLYACEIGNSEEWRIMLDRIAETGGFSDDVKKYAQELARIVLGKMELIDRTISEMAANWELKRMAAIDRNILRIAVAELRYMTDVPYRVVIDEAVELAKAYGTDDSGKFVNGIIDSIHKRNSATFYNGI